MGKFTFTGTRTNGIKDGIRSTTESPQWYTKFEAITNMADYFSLPYTGVVDRPDLQVVIPHMHSDAARPLTRVAPRKSSCGKSAATTRSSATPRSAASPRRSRAALTPRNAAY